MKSVYHSESGIIGHHKVVVVKWVIKKPGQASFQKVKVRNSNRRASRIKTTYRGAPNSFALQYLIK